MMVKNEENPRRHSMSCAADGEAQAARCVKRRRRDSTAVARISDDTQSQPQHQVDQTSTASTVKRSSKFRGVSRSEQGSK